MRLRTLIAGALLILSAAAPALAAGQANLREACRQDVKQLCPGVHPGGGRITQCLRANADKVSQACKEAALAARAASEKVQEACREDVKQLCPGAQPGGGAIRQCLRANADKVSDGCKQAIQAARAANLGP